MDTLYLQEKQKYEKMWSCDLYRQRSPGFLLTTFFLHYFQGRITPRDTLIDFGCGTGAASLFFFEKGLSVTLVDIADNCLSDDVKKTIKKNRSDFTFIQATLWDLPYSLQPTDWIYCIDVLEHLPTKQVLPSLAAMAKKTKKGGALQLFLEDESMGDLVGETLHLTLRPLDWWLKQISAFWPIEHVQEIIPNVRYCVYIGPGISS
jgi:ubiquinone/menaquinone biosynthesis C-methylase UbiE